MAQSDSDAVSTITLVEFKSAATMLTVKFCPSALIVCLENPELGGVLLVGGSGEVGVTACVAVGVGTTVGVGVGIGAEDGVGGGVGVAVRVAVGLGVGIGACVVEFFTRITAEVSVASNRMIRIGVNPACFKGFMSS